MPVPALDKDARQLACFGQEIPESPMKLMKSTTSPFGRLAHMMLIEAGLQFEIELVNPWIDPPQLVALNPARRVPTLQLDDGTILTETMMIAMYAADHAPAGSHLKHSSARAYEITGLAFGAIEAAVYIMNGRKIISDDVADTAFDSHPLAERRRSAMQVGLSRVDGMADRLRTDKLGLAELSVVDAVQYMDFRFPDAEWRPQIPNLDAWIERISDIPSVRDTLPF